MFEFLRFFDLGLMIAIWPLMQGLWSMVNLSFGWLCNQWVMVRSDNKYQMRLLGYFMVVMLALLSVGVVLVILKGYVPFWLANPFSVPLHVSLLTSLVIMLTPVVIYMPVLFYLERFPPETWMYNRIARLKS
jgi:hypothetical protein